MNIHRFLKTVSILTLGLISAAAGDLERGAWYDLPGRGIDIGIGAGDQMYMVGAENGAGGGKIYKWTGASWKCIAGEATRIDVGPDGKPWVVNKLGRIFKGDGDGGWQVLPGRATDIGVGTNGQVFITGAENGASGGNIYTWNESAFSWTRLGGEAIRVDVDANGKPWVVNKQNHIFKGDGFGGWEIMPGRATDIGVGANGKVCIIGVVDSIYGGTTYELQGDNWESLNGIATAITVGPDVPACINKENKVFIYSY